MALTLRMATGVKRVLVCFGERKREVSFESKGVGDVEALKSRMSVVIGDIPDSAGRTMGGALSGC